MCLRDSIAEGEGRTGKGWEGIKREAREEREK